MAKIIIGIVLVLLQIASYVGNIYAGGLTFFTTFSLNEIVYFLSFNLVGIIGLVLLISGIRSITKEKSKTEQGRKKDATVILNNEPIVDTMSETDTEITPPKKDKHKESTVLTKGYSFVLKYKKVFLILTILSSILFIASLITYTALDTHMSKMADHYFETRVCIESAKITEFGCGMISCPYCEGTVVRNYNYGRGIYSIGKYSRISDIRTLFESCSVVFASLAVVGLTALIILFVHHRKNSSKADTLQDT